VKDLESKQVLQILAEPTITTISGVKADFLSGGEFPFPMVQPGGTGSSPVITIQFREYGVKLEFTPTVNSDGTIRLKVAPEVSSLDYTNSATISGFTVPALATRRAETEVELRSDQSFAISGLLDQQTTDIMSKTPGAANIPILGALFKSKNVNHSTTELVVIVTPTLVDPLTETAEPAQPDLPIPTLNSGKFDKSLGKDLNPHPSAPPINPEQSPVSYPAPAATSSSAPAATPPPAPVAVPVADTVQNVTPAQAHHGTAAPPASNPENGSAGSTASKATLGQPTMHESGISVAGAPASGIAAPPVVASSESPRRYVFDNPTATPSTGGKPAVEPDTPSQSMVQIMTLANKDDAESMAAALKRHGYKVAVNHDPQDSLLHLEVGPFANKTDAEAMRQRLLSDGYNASIR
jgi:cell division septation protein DedD